MNSSSSTANFHVEWTYTGDTVPENGNVVITSTTSNPINGTFETYFKSFSKDLIAKEGDVRIDADGATWMVVAGTWHKLHDQFIIKEII